MAFQTEPTRTPTGIADVEVRLYDPKPGQGTAAAYYSVQIEMDDGTIIVRDGVLTPHLTQTQINGLLSFMQAMRTKAIAEFLP